MEGNSVRYFLGANSAQGFYSLYDGFVDLEKGDFLWVIKGGPGCGKSTFMKRIGKAAENAGLTVEYIVCSGDPDSLDGVYIKEARCAYVDGTAPHVIETKLPAAAGLYLDLGAFFRAEELTGERERLSSLFRRYRARYARAYDLLRAAELVSPRRIPGLVEENIRADVARRAASAARRSIPAGEGYREKHRFVSAISCQGVSFLWEGIAAQCPKVCTLDNALGLAPVFLKAVRQICAERGQPVILCPDPLRPAELEALLAPEAGVAFVAVDRERPYPGAVWRHMRLDAMADDETLRRLREEYRTAVRAQSQLLDMARESLVAAKALHDELENVYKPHVDFEGQNQLCQKHIDYLLGQME